MFQLCQNYPNPFNLETTINYSIYRNAKVNISVYNVSGRFVRTLINKQQRAGNYIIQWDGRNENGISIASGVYFYSLQYGEYTDVKRCIFIK